MIEKPIIFSGPMVRAIFEGRKTQTRRVIKPQPDEVTKCGGLTWTVADPLRKSGFKLFLDNGIGLRTTLSFAPYPVGTRLWVRETFATRSDLSHIEYRADRQDPVGLPFEHIYDEHTKWRSSMFMPRKYSRIGLLVTDVRCQRLQDITESDAIAEGASPWPHPIEQPMTSGELGHVLPYRGGFACLWDDINADRGYSWVSNPWVWAYTFEVVA